MGRLITRVREAEERLAGIARALQSAYDEEQREAQAAREAAEANLHRAEAMAQAARALGRDELFQRLAEVIEQLRESEGAARARLAELAQVEETVRARLDAPVAAPPLPPAPPIDRTPPPGVPPLPAPRGETVDPAPAGPPPPPFDPAVPPDPSPTTRPPPPAGVPKVDELRQKLGPIAARVAEIEKAAKRLPAPVLRLAVQEYVALVRLVGERLDEARADGAAETAPLLARLGALAATPGVGPVAGLDPDEFDDWSKVAARARADRQALAGTKPKP